MQELCEALQLLEKRMLGTTLQLHHSKYALVKYQGKADCGSLLTTAGKHTSQLPTASLARDLERAATKLELDTK